MAYLLFDNFVVFSTMSDLHFIDSSFVEVHFYILLLIISINPLYRLSEENRNNCLE